MELKTKIREILATGIGKAAFIAVMYVVIWGGLFAVAEIFAEQEEFALIFVALFAYFGWQALNKITPRIFLFMPLIGWVIYFFVKGLLSIIIGMFVAPFVISTKIAKSI